MWTSSPDSARRCPQALVVDQHFEILYDLQTPPEQPNHLVIGVVMDDNLARFAQRRDWWWCIGTI